MKKILCIGTATIDIIVVIPDENIEKMKHVHSLQIDDKESSIQNLCVYECNSGALFLVLTS